MKKPKTLWLLAGLPGSGKSTYLRERMFKEPHSVYISRDEIRFSMLNDGDEYFSKEDEVFAKFISDAEGMLTEPYIYDVYMDATHLNAKSRRKTLNAFKNLKNYNVGCIYFDVPLNICLERNAKRSGRALVPEDTIRSMSRRLTKPAGAEHFDKIIVIDAGGNEV